MESKEAQIFNFCLILIIIVFGVLGNVASFIVFSRGKQCRVLACSFYFKCLAISDTFVLLFPGLQLLLYLPPIDIQYSSYSEFACKITTYNVMLGAQVSAWIVVILTVERTLTICFPLQFRTDSSFVKPYGKIAIILLVFAATNCFYLYDNQLLHYSVELPTLGNNSGNGSIVNFTSTNAPDTIDVYVCYPTDLELSSLYTQISMGVFSFAIPFVINLVCNILILNQIKHRMNPQADTDKEHNAGRNKAKDKTVHQFAYRVMAVSVVFCISTGPVSLLVFLPAEVIMVIPMYVIRLFNALYYLNSGVNFILYCASGRDFRQDFVDIFQCKKPIRAKNTYSCTPPNTNSTDVKS